MPIKQTYLAECLTLKGVDKSETEIAEHKRLYDIFHYYKHKANLKTARKIVFKIINETIDLDKNPEMGQIEEFLIERPQEFRYLISSNYKIIYYILILLLFHLMLFHN